jgi:hypothetical protein
MNAFRYHDLLGAVKLLNVIILKPPFVTTGHGVSPGLVVRHAQHNSSPKNGLRILLGVFQDVACYRKDVQ